KEPDSVCMKRPASAASPVLGGRGSSMSRLERATPCTRLQSVSRNPYYNKKFLARFLGGFSQGSENASQVVFDNCRPSDPLGVRYTLLDLRQETICRLLPLQLGQFGLFCL